MQYRLLPPIYVGVLPVWSGTQMVVSGPQLAFSVWWGYLGLQLLYALILAILQRATGDFPASRWKWSFHPPWVGYLPSHMMAPGRLLRLHGHAAGIGSAVVALSFAWLPHAVWWNLVALHAYILLPRFVLLYSMRHSKPSLLKIDRDSTSLYEP